MNDWFLQELKGSFVEIKSKLQIISGGKNGQNQNIVKQSISSYIQNAKPCSNQSRGTKPTMLNSSTEQS